MACLAYFASLFVITTVASNSVYAQSAGYGVQYGQFGGYRSQTGRNISSYYGLAGRFDGDGIPLNLSMVSRVFSDILESPAVKIVTRVYELYSAQMEPINVLSAVLSSAEMNQLIDDWLTWSDVTPDVITTVQSLVSSPELITVIDVFVYDNTSSTSEQLCAVHNFTKIPEFRQLLDILTSSVGGNTTNEGNTTMSQFESALGELSGLEDKLPDIFNWNEIGFAVIVFSPAVDTVLDIYCDLVRRHKLQDTDHDTMTQHDDDQSDPPMAQAQALSDVADLTGLSTDELLDQLQTALNAPEIAEIIGNINSTFNIDQIITQLQTSITSGNLRELLQIFSQLQNGSLGNETLAFQELITDIVQQLDDTWVIVQPIVRQFIENFIRETLTENGVSDSCQDSSFVFVQALLAGEMWTLQFFDAMGKPPSDLLALRTNWLGSFDECTAITSSSIDGAEPFDGKYCRTTISIPELQTAVGGGLTLGTCVPSTCSATDTLGLLLTVQKLLLNGSTPIIPSVDCVEDKVLGTDAVIVTCILVIIGFIVVCGTLYDVVIIQSKSKSSKTGSTDATSGTRDSLSSTTTTSGSSNSSLPASLYKPTKTRLETSPGFINNVYSSGDDDLDKDPVKISEEEVTGKQNDAVKPEGVTLNIENSKDEKCTPDANDSKGSLERIMLSFSAYTNGVKVLNTEQPAGALSAINGIRFLSMAWVILGHTYSFATSVDDNLLTHYADKVNKWTFSGVLYATVSVDSFFTISGILVGYLTLRQLEKVGGAKNMNWFLFYFHRFWRLTPSYMLILMAATVLLPYVATGPMWQEDFPGTEGCRKYWWTNLLYINNFVNIYPDTNMCMGWTWYLANDMQFYILSPLILLPLFYNVIAGIVSCVVFLAATITTTAIIVHKHEYPAQLYNLLYAPTPKDGYFFQRLYLPFYTRMGPYIIGLFTGYMLYRLKSKCRIPKIVNLLCWFVCLAICCLIVYGPYSYEDDHIFTQLQSEVFHALHRTGWGVAICWIVFACATGNGGWINDLLSWRPFIPLGRLTYGAYLLHPLAIFLFYTSRRIPTYFTDYEVAYLFIGHLVLSYGAAFVTCLMFESPMMGLEKVIFGKHKK